MPELPEVEVVRSGLAPRLEQRRIASARILHPRAIRHNEDSPEAFAAQLCGRQIEAVSRRGKFMWLRLDGEEAVVVHLGMSGQMLLSTDPHAHDSHPHLRAALQLENGPAVWFVDQRTFGYWRLDELVSLGEQEQRIPASISHIARDLLDPEVSMPQVAAGLKQRARPIKALLLEQTIVSGVGNIYADEMLWAAGIAPTRSAQRISLQRLRALLESGQQVMRRALAQGGTSFDDLYVNVNGASGYFARSLNAYGQEGLPCARCGTEIRRITVVGRSTYFCGRCQH
ncbi:bifunctional DNA-formamidopyrimidine glycosylase/DNA-(apurinic or apyrimidinic site) lyase [Corynebacterium sp. 11A]|uniref:bifunctional DNA-formamidopyrimidine glycosylase/DNA-(apurinic or apyrimidinic site) lyase n=1 Tax=Corynebacterium sp. 11A TaxID=2080510 RepID=UPI00124D95A0|nr:bifunctional DNA-formamidopyrimidine glycosylase/DNA-(apurinic or apyrimidinic site) lyase [Corynebacterium sp. 11A]